MGLSRLVLVQPKAFPAEDASARASGADDVLANAQVVDSLEQALVGCNLVMGTSARERSIPAADWPARVRGQGGGACQRWRGNRHGVRA